MWLMVAGLQIIDIEPQNRHMLSRQLIQTKRHGVAVFNGYAYAANFTAGLKIIDITSIRLILSKLVQ
jgi:hypothetical protein